MTYPAWPNRTVTASRVDLADITCRFVVLPLVFLFMLGSYLLWCASGAHAAARLKDIVDFEGVRENMLIGYGLVVGLNGTGDKLQNNAFTEQSLIAFLERQGVNTRGQSLKSKNVAAVTITAVLPPFARNGSRIDVTVSTMGDATNLTGGTLLATPLYAADGEVYAVAQGAVSIGGFKAGSDAANGTASKGVPTSGFILSGAIVEKEIEFALNNLPELKLSLRNPDISTARHISETINAEIGPGVSAVTDPATVVLAVPEVYRNNATLLLAEIEKLPIETDQAARIVIDESSGTIVMGENVRINTVAVAQGNLVVRVEEKPEPAPGEAAGDEAAAQPAVIADAGPGKRMALLKHGATLRDLVAGLNALGVGPRDLITILQTIKAAGALQAEIQTR